MESPTTAYDSINVLGCNNGIYVSNYENPSYIGSPNLRLEESQGVVYGSTAIGSGDNAIIASNRLADGNLEPFGAFGTNGLSASVLPGEVFAYNLISIGNGILAVTNPGSNSISIFVVNEDFTLTLTSTAETYGQLPFTMAETNGLLYVADYDVTEDFVREDLFDRQSPVTAFTIDYETGQLGCVEENVNVLGGTVPGLRVNTKGDILVAEYNVPSYFTPNDELIVLTSLRINPDGSLSELSEATVAGDPAVNWPSPGGFEIKSRGEREYVVVTEVRDYHYDTNSPNGATQSYLASTRIQPGTVTSYELLSDGSFSLVNTVALADYSLFGACWIVFNPDATIFWVANFGNFLPWSDVISSFSMDENGNIELLDPYAASVDGDTYGFQGALDLWMSEDGQYLFAQYAGGLVQGFEVADNGFSLIPVYETFPGSTLGLVVLDKDSKDCIPCDKRRSLLMGDMPCC